MSRTYAPLFPLRAPEKVREDCESLSIRGMADRWYFMILWMHEPKQQFSGIENCTCLEEKR